MFFLWGGQVGIKWMVVIAAGELFDFMCVADELSGAEMVFITAARGSLSIGADSVHGWLLHP